MKSGQGQHGVPRFYDLISWLQYLSIALFEIHRRNDSRASKFGQR